MKKYLFTILFLAGFAAGAFATEDLRTLRIRVLDENKNYLEDVKIILTTHDVDSNGWWKPDVSKSSVAYTGSEGLAVFDGDNRIDFGLLQAGDQEYNDIYRSYQLIITSHTYSPTGLSLIHI